LKSFVLQNLIQRLTTFLLYLSLSFKIRIVIGFNSIVVVSYHIISTIFPKVPLFLVAMVLFLFPEICTSVQKTVFYLHFIDGASESLSIPLLRILARCEMNKLLYACVTCSPSRLLLLRPLFLSLPPSPTQRKETERLPHPPCMFVRFLCD